ncbi:MAG: thiamine phosphate synthase [Lachnospiraceae bacterium]|nr:thiamine phosphate synthase [Lachnoclostridium sp.]MDY2599621.1 thiamine phosphate synthase [Lachnospiraceae bacterium]
MDDFKLICVTNRKLCKGYEKYGFDAFYDRISEIVNMKQDIRPASIILREKDLSEEEYREVAKRLKTICDRAGVVFCAHNYALVAEELGTPAHFPLHVLEKLVMDKKISKTNPRNSGMLNEISNGIPDGRSNGMPDEISNGMPDGRSNNILDGRSEIYNLMRYGASCHSVEDALCAYKLGCDYVTAGHVYITDCKKGLAPRGIDFLKKMCDSVPIPVYGIGGIDLESDKIDEVKQAGAKGACIMSGYMKA